MNRSYQLLNDPVFYITLVFLAAICTAIPLLLGQPRFLPIVQSIGLVALMSIALRRQQIGRALVIVGLWVLVQLAIVIGASYLLPELIERAIEGGFSYRTMLLQWFFGNGAVPPRFAGALLGRLDEVAGVVIGALLSAGLIGAWFLEQAINLAGYGAGTLLRANGGIGGLLGGLPPWSVVRFMGEICLLVLGAEPLLTGNWSIGYYWRERRGTMLIGLALTVIGLVLEVSLPDLWRAWLAPLRV